MATQKKRRPARRSSARKGKSVSSGIPLKFCSWLLMVVFLFFSLGMVGYVVFFQTVQAAEMPEYEDGQSAGVVFEEPNPPEHHEPAAPQSKITSQVPQIAIIIDDMGYHLKECEDLLAIPYSLTFSFLPFSPHMEQTMDTAYQNGRTILLHLPMQPKSDKWDAGEGALLIGENQEKQMRLLESNLQRVHYATGVNNHMGSLYTEQIEPMRGVLSYLKKNGLFWVDSFTTSDSVGFLLAHELGVKSARRHVFLDNVQETEKICAQLEKLVSYAEEKGNGIGIGHPYPQTVAALQKCLPKYDSRVVVVGVDELVN